VRFSNFSEVVTTLHADGTFTRPGSFPSSGSYGLSSGNGYKCDTAVLGYIQWPSVRFESLSGNLMGSSGNLVVLADGSVSVTDDSACPGTPSVWVVEWR
jgi:hypothetical protein